MTGEKIQKFMQLGGQSVAKSLSTGSVTQRQLGARLLLSEVLEYVIHGLGITPTVNGVKITDADAVDYAVTDTPPDKTEMLDGLADVAYTMYWNALAFGIPLEEAFQLVCDNNLEKFVKLSNWTNPIGELSPDTWHCGADIKWPEAVVRVEVVRVNKEYFAVGKDSSGKVRKPAHYRQVDLSQLLAAN